MGILFRFAVILGIIWAGYTFVADKIIENKLPELKQKTSEFINPKKARADLLENLELKLDNIGSLHDELNSIDLESIEDPEIRELIKGLRDNASPKDLAEIAQIVKDMERLNDKDGIFSKNLGRIIERILPQREESTPTPTINISSPTPNSDPPSQQCSWVCD